MLDLHDEEKSCKDNKIVRTKIATSSQKPNRTAFKNKGRYNGFIHGNDTTFLLSPASAIIVRKNMLEPVVFFWNLALLGPELGESRSCFMYRLVC